MPIKLKEELVYAAIDGFTAQKHRIDSQIAELRTLLNGSPAASTIAPGTIPRKRRKMSAAARRRIGAAQRARWAKVKDESALGPAGVKALKKKRKISPEGLRNIIAATKRRWRLQKAGAKAK